MRKNPVHNINKSDGISEYYTLLGNHSFLDEDGFPRLDNQSSKLVFAKCVRNKLNKTLGSSSQFRFYMLLSPSNKPYNPIPKEAISDGRKFIDKVCKDPFIFKEVNQIIFQKYLEFLKSKNTRWITDIERDLK